MDGSSNKLLFTSEELQEMGATVIGSQVEITERPQGDLEQGEGEGTLEPNSGDGPEARTGPSVPADIPPVAQPDGMHEPTEPTLVAATSALQDEPASVPSEPVAPRTATPMDEPASVPSEPVAPRAATPMEEPTIPAGLEEDEAGAYGAAPVVMPAPLFSDGVPPAASPGGELADAADPAGRAVGPMEPADSGVGLEAAPGGGEPPFDRDRPLFDEDETILDEDDQLPLSPEELAILAAPPESADSLPVQQVALPGTPASSQAPAVATGEEPHEATGADHRPLPPPPPKAALEVGHGLESVAQSEVAPWYAKVFDETYLVQLRHRSREGILGEIDGIIGLLSLPKGSDILDVACGDGTHANELALRGYSVVGMDLSPVMIQEARRRAALEETGARFVLGDMRGLVARRRFDGILCLGTSFGYFDDPSNVRLLKAMASALRPGGRLILELLNRDYVAAQQPVKTWYQLDDVIYLEETGFDPLTSRLHVERQLGMPDGGQRVDRFDLRIYSPHELRNLMVAMGLEVIGVYTSLAGFHPLIGVTSRKMVLVSQKPLGEDSPESD